MAQTHGGALFWGRTFWTNFLGNAPDWYKYTIVGFLIANPLLYDFFGGFFTGWVLVLQFIFTLALALRCYPLQAGGLLAIEALAIGMTGPADVYLEVENNLPVVLLLVFMVAGIYFMKELLLFIFTKILLSVRSRTLLSFLFCSVSAVLSAFLDALTVTAVVIGVAVGFHRIYSEMVVKTALGRLEEAATTEADDEPVPVLVDEKILEDFSACLRGLVMHAAVGTALGGVTTLVGEPQNLLIAKKAGWEFLEFFWRMSPVTLPVLAVGLVTCLLLEKFKWLGYGKPIPESVLAVLRAHEDRQRSRRTHAEVAQLVAQAAAAIVLVFALAFHVAEIGLIGLAIIILQTAFNGIIEEKRLGPAFEEALPFTALLCVFFAIVAVIESQHLFQPVIDYVLTLSPKDQPGIFYIANGVLSMISDNVFVATVYINQVREALDNGSISRGQFDLMAVAINTGTNIPSVATPNGQAAFLFLLTSSLAPLIQLSYGRMVLMALPYTITMGTTGYLCVQIMTTSG